MKPISFATLVKKTQKTDPAKIAPKYTGIYDVLTFKKAQKEMKSCKKFVRKMSMKTIKDTNSAPPGDREKSDSCAHDQNMSSMSHSEEGSKDCCHHNSEYSESFSIDDYEQL